ncbi:MAG: hypothetical protein V1684_00605 [bacterium]
MSDLKLVQPKIYKKIGLSFIILTALLTVAVVYFSFSEATISLTPSAEKASVEFSVRVMPEAELANYQGATEAVAGGVYDTAVRGRQTFQATSNKNIEAQATGQATIVNNYSKDQPLVATTRLLTADGVLFRLSKKVNVPAGGKVLVEIYADQPGQKGEIGPTRFTIPGLWEGLKDKIYAESAQPMTGGFKKTTAVAQEDIDRASQALADNLFQEALKKLNETAGLRQPAELTFKTENIAKEISGQQFSASVGDQVSEFTAEMTLRIVAVTVDQSALMILAEEKLKKSAPADKELGNIDPRSFNYQVERYDLASRAAEVKVYLEGNIALRLDSLVLDKEKIAGLTEAEAKAYFAGLTEIKAVEIKFSPFWVKKIPNLTDHIKINIRYQ